MGLNSPKIPDKNKNEHFSNIKKIILYTFLFYYLASPSKYILHESLIIA